MNLPKTIYKRAEKEAVNSQLPGRQDGPADAYRHILAAAEAVRQGYPEWLTKPFYFRPKANRSQIRIRLHPGIVDFLADQEDGRYGQAAQNILESWFYQTASTKQLQTYIKPYEPDFDDLISKIKGDQP